MSFYASIDKGCNVLTKQVNLKDYRVTVVDCSIPESLLLQHSPCTIEVFHADQFVKKVLVQLPDLSNFHLVESLSKKLRGAATVSVNDSGQIKIVTENHAKLIFSKTLTNLLGLESQTVQNSVTASHPLTALLLTNRVIILANFVQPFYCNGIHLPCMYQGPPNFHALTPQYHEALDKTFGSLDIRLLNFALEEISMPDGTFSILLHFEKFLKHW